MADGHTRRTIQKPVELEGIGLHTGEKSSIRLKPARAGQGILFNRTDRDGKPIPATIDNVTELDRRTVLGQNGATIETVEHLMSALLAHRIDDLEVDLDGPEVPSLDGSAGGFFRAVARAGVREHENTTAGALAVSHPMMVTEGDSRYTVTPFDGLRVTCTIEWDHPLIGRQSGCYDIDEATYKHELADSRTFGFLSEAKELSGKGLIQGASEENTVILGDNGTAVDLRWPDEFVRHKTVDLLGDLALLGTRIDADITAFRPSHRGNLSLARALRAHSLRTPPVMGIQEILGVIPHRYPMLLVDRILEIDGARKIVGIKNVTINEPFFQGHFPGHPIMPGVLVVEAMAQVGGMLLLGAVENPENKVVYFMSIDKVKFRRPVVPGDQVRFELEMLQFRGKTCKMKGVGLVEGQVAAEAEMMAMVVER